MPRIPVGRFFAALLTPGGGLAFVRARGRSGLPDRPAPSHRGCHGGGDWARRHRRWDGRLARPRCGAAASCRKGSRCPRSGTGSAEPVMYLPWAGDGPVMHPPYTCAGDTPDR